MNNYFNFKLPNFISEYGSDWQDFVDIMEEYCDELYLKTEQLYKIIDINKMIDRNIINNLILYRIYYDSSYTPAMRRTAFRSVVTESTNKGLRLVYHNICLSITGLAPDFYLGLDLVHRWNTTRRWNFSRWPATGTDKYFQIYIDVKTIDNTELDNIANMIRQDQYSPIFYRVYLVDSSFTVLRSI